MRGRRTAAAMAALAALMPLSACTPGPSVSFTATPTVDPGPAVPAAAAPTDVHYVPDGTRAHTLDVYLPRTSRASYPLVIFVHGGSWEFGDKAMPLSSPTFGALRINLNSHGFAVASINYRFTMDARFPAQIHDVKAAIRYLRAHAAELQVDPARFAIVGDSAGGQLALLAGMTADSPALEGTLGTTGASSGVRAIVSYFGVSDLAGIETDRRDAGCPVPKDPATSAEGKLVGGNPASGTPHLLALQASPLTYATASKVPMLLFHGTKDCIVPVAQSQKLQRAVSAAGGTAELSTIPAGHAVPAFYQDAAPARQLIDFLDRHLAS